MRRESTPDHTVLIKACVFLAVPILASIKIISDDVERLKPTRQILSWNKKEKSDGSALK